MNGRSMCIYRKIGACTYNSFLQYQGKEYVLVSDQLNSELDLCTLMDITGKRITVSMDTEVLSHFMSPIKFRRLGNSKGCHKGTFPLFKFDPVKEKQKEYCSIPECHRHGFCSHGKILRTYEMADEENQVKE